MGHDAAPSGMDYIRLLFVSSKKRFRVLACGMRWALTLATLCLLAATTTAHVSGASSSKSASPRSQGESEAIEFEVATIKPAAVDQGGYRHISLNISADGRVKITNWTLKQLICAAYNLNYWQLEGGEGWTDKDLYDVEAKPPDPNGASSGYSTHHDNWSLDDPKLRAMLQGLLRERFELKVHTTETRGSIYLLERSDKDTALVPSKHPRGLGGIGAAGGSGYRLSNTSMPQLAAYLSGVVFHQPVIDHTGLDGIYDFQSKLILTDEDIRANDPSMILPAVKEMGLKLTRSTGPVIHVVIDSVALPSAN